MLKGSDLHSKVAWWAENEAPRKEMEARQEEPVQKEVEAVPTGCVKLGCLAEPGGTALCSGEV